MKKVLIVVVILFSLFLFTGCENKEHIKTIKYTELKEKFDNKESFVILFTKEGCTYCAQYEPILKSVLKKYDITIYNLVISDLNEKEDGELKTYVNISGTPTIAFIKNGEEKSTMNRIVGLTDKETTIEKFKDNGYIK